MSTHKETRLVHCYDPVAFVIAVEQGVKDGFSLDLVTPEHYPVVLGYQYICTMVKDVERPQRGCDLVEKEVKNPQKAQEEAVVEQTAEGTQDQSEAVVEAPKKAGRPAKGK